MKTNKKFLVMMAAMMLMATSAWASGTITVVKMLNGTANDAAGTVTSSVSATNNVCTLTVTPAEGNYATKEGIAAERVISGDLAQSRRRNAPEMSNLIEVSATDATADPSGMTTYTFQMPDTGYDVEVTVNFQSRQSIAGGTLTLTTPAEGYTYDGEAKEPAVTVTLGGETLAATDYTVAYGNDIHDNIDAGEVTVTVTGAKTYTGTLTKTFTIAKASIEFSVGIDGWTYGTYSDEVNIPYTEGLEDLDVMPTYTYKAKNAADNTYTETVPTDAGDYVIRATVAETANYAAGEATAEFTIGKAELGNVNVTIEGWTYGDTAKTPVVNGNIGKGAETFEYASQNAVAENWTTTVPTDAGSYLIKATIAETANYLGTTVRSNFPIQQASLSAVVIADIADQDYTGSQITPDITVTFNGNVVDASEYTVNYGENTNVGQGTVTLATTNKNFVAGEVSPQKTFNILGTELSMGGHQWITYQATANLTIPAGLAAYIVTAVNDRSVTAQQVNYIPQGVGILLTIVGAEVLETYVATRYTGEEGTFDNNLLQGCAEATPVSDLTAERNIYVLYNDEFVKTTSGTIPVGRAYLPVSKTVAAGARLAINFADEATGINVLPVNGEKRMEDGYFDLNGRRLSAKPAKAGLYISNGRKVVIK